ncbi:uncharacterized protein LOC117174972 isoform X3 [Belonocnema kinseyi]|uniref:uncharacterized protein LOC117174972 isoform X3 n=1 Tax=Belonocnema kinseyi TaxID=2817044 RepID=UPI00143CFA57|nr:uncharacterized protein LOC117174972 isoform X3 [Belonocnema kinseyi]
MIVRFIEIRGVVVEVMNNHPDSLPMITPKEIEELMEVSNILKPREEITREWSAEKYVTISKVIPTINGLREGLSTKKTKSNLVNNLKTEIRDEIKLRFGLMEEVKHFAVATLLDPRFKKIDLKDHSRCALAIAIVKTLFDRKVQASALDGSKSDESSENLAGKKNSLELSIRARHHKLAERDQRRKPDITDELPPELSLFHINPVVSLKTDPIKWLFSKAGENMTARRNRLSGERLHKQPFLSSTECSWANKHCIRKCGRRRTLSSFFMTSPKSSCTI